MKQSKVAIVEKNLQFSDVLQLYLKNVNFIYMCYVKEMYPWKKCL